MTSVLCEICQEREPNHFSAIVCMDCYDFLRERDPCFWPIFSQWHDYHAEEEEIKAHWLRTMRYAWRDYCARKEKGRQGDAGVEKGEAPLGLETRPQSEEP